MKIQINPGKSRWLFTCCGLVLLCSLVSLGGVQQTGSQQSPPQSAKPASRRASAVKLPPNARITEREVIAVQIELRRLGFLKTGLSGKLDPGTRTALRSYQKQNSLPITEKIDHMTYEKLGLPYPAPDPEKNNIVGQVGSTVAEGTRYGLEKSWDAGSYAASKSKDAAEASWEGLKVSGRAAQRKADSMIRRNDDDTAKDISDLFLEHMEWSGVIFSVKDGMVTLKVRPTSEVNVGSMVHEVRKVAGVRSVFVIIL